MARRRDIEDIDVEPIQEEGNRIRKPPAYRDMDDAQYIHCTNREKFIALAYTDKRSAMRLLRENEKYFKRSYSSYEKEEMHRYIVSFGYSGLTTEDMSTLNDIFGSLQPVKRTEYNTQYSETAYRYKPPQTVKEWLVELNESTFPRFRKWMNNNRSRLEDLDASTRNLLCEVFENQLINKYVLPFQESEGFKEDDMVWIREI